jgi:hypothetical protein
MDEEFSPALLTGCVLLASRRWALPCNTCRAIRPPACRSACHRRRARCPPAPTNERSLRAPGPVLVGHAVELATAQPPPTTMARSKPTPRLAQHRLRQLRAPGADSGRRRAGHGRSRRPRRPRPSQPSSCLPHRRAPGPHFGRTQRTRQRTDTGRRHRTPDTWTLRRPHRTPDTGPVDRQAWTLVTGHWPRTWTG